MGFAPVSDHTPVLVQPQRGLLRGPRGHRKALSRQGFLGPKLPPAPGIPDAEVRGGTVSHGGQSKGWKDLSPGTGQNQLLQVSGHPLDSQREEQILL